MKFREMSVSKFDLADQGEGNFALSGDMSFETAEQILRASEKSFPKASTVEVDLSGVVNTDSAGLALLLEWMSWANRSDTRVQFTAIPEKVLAIAQTAELDNLLKRSYSSSSR